LKLLKTKGRSFKYLEDFALIFKHLLQGNVNQGAKLELKWKKIVRFVSEIFPIFIIYDFYQIINFGFLLD